ncbi:MAG: tetratricopeptide repeat protein [Planctomycetota bacterium]
MSVSARLSESWDLLLARLALWAGRRDRARLALKRVLRRDPGSFRARFALGRVYLLENAVFKAKREFDLAWQIAPERFEGCYARLRARFRDAPDLFSYGEPREEVPVSLRTPRARRYGDFRDEQEWRRFRRLPPISREEIASVDWGQLEDEIFPD